jgi:PmbA protein
MNSQVSATSLLEDLAKRAHGAEIHEVRSFQMPVRFLAGMLASVRAVETAGRALRVIKDGRLGFSTTTDLADRMTVVQNALESAQFGDRVSFDFPVHQQAQTVGCFDVGVDQLDEARLIALGEEIVDTVRDYDPELLVDVTLTKEVEEVRLLNTSGLELCDQRTLFSIEAKATRTREGEILIVRDEASSRRVRDVNGLALAENIVDRLRRAEVTAEVESKAMTVVLDSIGSFALLLPLIFGLDGRQVYLGASPLGDKVGQGVLDSRITLVDDARLGFAPRSAPWDDEGVSTTKKPLIERGVLRQFLYDLKTAAQAGALSTGNGFKSGGLFGGGGFRQQPGVSAASWLIPPGSRSPEQILEDLGEALLVEQVIGLGQGNIMAGEFSVNVSLGFLVRKGEIVGRVKNTMIAGNAYDLLRDQLIALGDRSEWVAGMLRTPAIAVDGVGVVSKG